MPIQFASAPEALLGRNDSKNAATTCKGITSSGRPCRRALAVARATTFQNHAGNGVWLYCWQHKDQAGADVREEHEEDVAKVSRRRRSTELKPLQERTSLDTLVQRLGINDTPQEESQRRRARNDASRQRPAWENHPSQQVYTQDEAIVYNAPQVGQTRPKPRPRPKPQPSFWQSLCCIVDNDDYLEVVRHRKRTEQNMPLQSVVDVQPTPRPAMTQSPSSLSSRTNPTPGGDGRRSSRPNTSRRYSSRTEQLFSLIPANLPPQTASSLLAELVKPISPNDEDGYIYIFWLTPQSKQVPTTSTARSLLAPPVSSGRPRSHHRRISDVMTEYSFSGSAEETAGEDVVMLKIGRANNVTRRMHEWQRQCGYELNLVRWYPYIPTSSPSPQPSPERHGQSQPQHNRRQSGLVRKVPFVKRVERLVHLELAQKQAKRQCEACGREHREWFEVKASQTAVKDVDDCVRRWVEWAERKRDAELGETR